MSYVALFGFHNVCLSLEEKSLRVCFVENKYVGLWVCQSWESAELVSPKQSLKFENGLNLEKR